MKNKTVTTTAFTQSTHNRTSTLSTNVENDSMRVREREKGRNSDRICLAV